VEFISLESQKTASKNITKEKLEKILQEKFT
jgi:hypothetical protein